MMSGAQTAKKRLMREMKDLSLSPVEGLGAMPLEANLMEWHCNLKCQDTIYHIILFFPDSYPGTSPSAEFVPKGLQFSGGASKPGQKGTQVCLSIFSDFKDYHPEWDSDSSAGWSPAYTVEKVLLNLLSFMDENMSSQTSGAFVPSYNKRLAEQFTCPDCGHCYKEPVPDIYIDADKGGEGSANGSDEESRVGAIKESEAVSDGAAAAGDASGTEGDAAAAVATEAEGKENEFPITCYMLLTEIESVDHIPEDDGEVFGFGLSYFGHYARPRIVSPCEYLSKAAFDHSMQNTQKVLTTYREEVHYFLPLFIHANHASKIKIPFEDVIQKIKHTHRNYFPGGFRSTIELHIMKLLSGLMCSAVVNFSKRKHATSDFHLSGYFVLHRLLLWAIDTYPDLQQLIEDKIQAFKDDETQRGKKSCPDIGDWLMLLSVSKNHRWSDVADAYLGESMKRNVQWYLKDCARLGDSHIPYAERLTTTYTHTRISNTLLAFQVAFLDVAWPADMTHEQVIARYDSNFGRPTTGMIRRMKLATEDIEKLGSYHEWYPKIQVPCPEEAELCERLEKSITFAKATDGYFFKVPPQDPADTRPPSTHRRGRGGGQRRGRGRRDDVLMQVAAQMFDND